MKRREFLKTAAAGVAGTAMLTGLNETIKAAEPNPTEKVRVGFIGIGGRGTDHLRTLIGFPEVEAVAVCDLFKEKTEIAAKICIDTGHPAPKLYFESDTAWQSLLEKEKLDLVIITTNWESHAAISEAALKKGIYVGCEVPIALSVEECWKLVEASEQNKTPCMMLENWSFRRDNLAVLNMIRLGMLGEILHAHGAYSHDARSYWFDQNGNTRWHGEHFLKENRSFYSTHGLGPIISWLDINVGDRFTELYAVATAARGANSYIKQKFGPDHPNAQKEFKQGDIVTCLLKTAKGKSVVLNCDTLLPRPYANRWMVQGTLGIYDEEKASIYLDGVSPKEHQWEPWKPYAEKYDHRYWKDVSNDSGGHGNEDRMELRLLIDAVKSKNGVPLDVYDSVTMSAVIGLSEMSIEQDKPIEFPDFTKGHWKDRKPYFAIDRML
ncbi:MAG: Gfo/Idh/MocA family oxidoreductase [Planctomycetaceae bacterium]|jgi:predicted dehydrogenase|nr:Gfo/Idh/MocA family oxidoreductase [Planctomycetaceae bacterium]